MRHITGLFTLAFIAALALAACGKSGGDKLVGTWAIDAEASAAAAERELSEQERAMLDSLEVTMTFEDDGSATMGVALMGQRRRVAGTYQVTGTEGDAITVELTGDAGDTKTLTFTFDGNDRFTTVEDERTMVMARQ